MAEVSTFFNKEIDLAIEFVHAAVEAGVDIFKTEILHNPNVCLKSSQVVHRYKHFKGETEEKYRDLVERKVVPLQDYRRLFDACHELKMPIVCSVYDTEGVDFLVAEGAAGIKFPRDSANNIGLIRYAGETGLPVVFDAGNLRIEEIALAVRTARESGAAGVVVNLHPAANPAPAEFHNLALANMYKKAFQVPVGLACHYRGEEILYAAVGAGVNLLEKGIVDDNEKEEQDVISAANLNELKDIVKRVRNCWLALGTGVPEIREPRDYASWKGMVAKVAIQEGEELSLANVGFAWPPEGISVGFWDLVVGKRVCRALEENEVIRWNDLAL
jgi:sialic acid synthase SpsE